MQSDVSFGRWLKQRRKALGLTQDDLARRVGCSVVTIRKIEVDERRPSRQIAMLLADHLAILPHERAAFLQFARGDAGPILRRLPDVVAESSPQPGSWQTRKHTTNLERPLTPLIGRMPEVLALRQLLTSGATRLLTVTGPAGIGKTRLAIESAAGLLEDFNDGVFLVPLETIFDPQLVPAAIGQTLGLVEIGQEPSRTRLPKFLRDKHLLLILDNFEQVVAAAPLVTELLAACPWLHVLVTSRASLHVRGERLFMVPPLDLPDPGRSAPLSSAAEYGAIALFSARAQEAYPRWALTQQNVPAVVSLCKLLDGLPLAIELAAARSRVLSPQDMLQQIGTQSALLTGGFRDLPERQQTLRGAIDWSYALLDPWAQRLLARLSVFNGGWTLQAATAICADTADDGAGVTAATVLDGLMTLVDQSLVRQETVAVGDGRYMMLNTIREYAREKLTASGELAELQARHLRYFLDLAETTELQLRGAQQRQAVARLEQEHDNLQAALAWCRSRPESTLDGLRLAGALGEFWFIRSYLSLGRGWLQALLSQHAYETTPIYAKALRYAGVLAGAQDDTEQALIWHSASIEISRTLGDHAGLAYALIDRWAIQDCNEPELEQHSLLLAEALDLARSVADPWLIARVSWRIGTHYYYIGRNEQQSRALLEESLAHARIADDLWCISNVLPHLSSMAWESGEYERANGLAEEALSIARSLGNQRGIANALNILGLVALALHDPARAQACHAESLSLSQTVGLGLQTAIALRLLGGVAFYQGAYQEAQTTFIQSLLHHRQLSDNHGSILCLLELARIAQITDQPEYAIQLLGAIDALLHAAQMSLSRPDRDEYHRVLAAARRRLDPATWQATWARGRKMTLKQTIDEALDMFGSVPKRLQQIPF
jgi:predicted ATPase/transcriptional regulator with XRE-family HTH domain